MKMKFHIRTNIKGMLKCYEGKEITFVNDDNGKRMTDKEVRKELAELIAKGHKYLPSSECDNFDPFEKGCLGHKCEAEENSNIIKDKEVRSI